MPNNNALKKDILDNLAALRRYAYSLTSNQHDADDLLQGVVEKLLTRQKPVEVELKIWAFRICKNMWIDDIRAKNVRIKAISTGELDQNAVFDGERSVISELTFGEVVATMQTLPEDLSTTLTLVAIEGFSYAEVASILGIPVGTVMSRVSRARQKLVETLNTKTKL